MIWSLLFGALPGVIQALAQARTDYYKATTDIEKIKVQERIKALEGQRDVLVAQTQSPWTSVARMALMGPFAVYLWWIIVNDKIVCKWYTAQIWQESVCRTDPLGDWLTGIFGIMIAFYFAENLFRKR